MVRSSLHRQFCSDRNGKMLEKFEVPRYSAQADTMNCSKCLIDSFSRLTQHNIRLLLSLFDMFRKYGLNIGNRGQRLIEVYNTLASTIENIRIAIRWISQSNVVWNNTTMLLQPMQRTRQASSVPPLSIILSDESQSIEPISMLCLTPN